MPQPRAIAKLVPRAQKRVWENLETNLNRANLGFSDRRLAISPLPLAYIVGHMLSHPERIGAGLYEAVSRIPPLSSPGLQTYTVGDV